jgi:hypothetical protein
MYVGLRERIGLLALSCDPPSRNRGEKGRGKKKKEREKSLTTIFLFLKLKPPLNAFPK